MLGLAQEPVAQIFARDQHPIGLELADLLAQHLNAARGIFHGEDRDGGVKAQFGALAAGAADDAAVRGPRAAIWSSQMRLLRVAPPRGGT